MKSDSRNPSRWNMNPSTDYNHNILIDRVFQDARAKAWAAIKEEPIIKQLIAEEDQLRLQKDRTRRDTSPLLELNQPTRQ